MGSKTKKSFVDKLKAECGFIEIKYPGHDRPYALESEYRISLIVAIPQFYHVGEDMQRELIVAKLGNLKMSIDSEIERVKEL